MLGDGEPMPVGVGFNHALMGVFFEIAEEVMFESGVVSA